MDLQCNFSDIFCFLGFPHESYDAQNQQPKFTSLSIYLGLDQFYNRLVELFPKLDKQAGIALY